jgi:hypothetical protein
MATDELDLGEDFGWVEVRLGQQQKRIDLIATYWRLMDALEGDPPQAEYSARCVVVLAELGFEGEVSFELAERFVRAIFDRVRTLKKKEGASPGSPATTGPESSGSDATSGQSSS